MSANGSRKVRSYQDSRRSERDRRDRRNQMTFENVDHRQQDYEDYGGGATGGRDQRKYDKSAGYIEYRYEDGRRPGNNGAYRKDDRRGKRDDPMKIHKGEGDKTKAESSIVDNSKDTELKSAVVDPTKVTNDSLNKADDIQTSADMNTQVVQQQEEQTADNGNLPEEKEASKTTEENEEQQKAEEEEQTRITNEELKILEDFVTEQKDRLEQRSMLREVNINAAANRPDESFFSRLDSSLKRNTAFVKKLRSLTESQKEALSKDFSSLNLSKYLAEMANALVEAKVKMSDINCVLHICSLAHQRYVDFSPLLLDSWAKVLLTKKDEKVPNPSKLRVDLRVFADLVAVGVFSEKEGLGTLANQLMYLVNNDKDEHNNVPIIISFCKHCGDDYAGLLPTKIRQLSEKYNISMARSSWLPEERKRGCRNLLKDYYSSLCRHLIGEHKELKATDKANRKILQTKGELSSEREERRELLFQSLQKLQQHTQHLADLLDEPLPQLPQEETGADDETMSIGLFNPSRDSEYMYDGESALFEDEDTRLFYEHLPDLKALVPQILYKDSEQATISHVAPDENIEESVEGVEREMEEKSEEPEKKDEDIAPAEVEEEETDVAGTMKQIAEAFFSNLPNCVNRDLIDRAATDFCMNLNTKVNRRKLLRTVFTVHRTRYDLLPFYSRLVATLHPCMPDLSLELAELLKKDFKWHVRKKDQINIESKLKTVRFIGELVKFKVFPRAEALHCVKMLLFDFSHHNIEMACALLDSCGRFMYRSSDSHHRTRIYLEVMMRKHKALHLDQRYATMIENTYYYCNPPDNKREERKKRPPIQDYIRKLLYKDLSKTTTEKVLRQMRKLAWDDPEIAAYAMKCLTAVWNLRYNVIHCCANLMAGLAPYHEDIAIHVVDNILEDVRLGMEVNHPRLNQRRVSGIKYLGELYNYRLLESAVIFKTLYSLITFGVTLDESVSSPLDAPEHLFRIRLVCVLLDTCGHYFDRGSSKRKLDCFLTYFQRYYQFKRSLAVWQPDVLPFPVSLEHLYQDTLEDLRPRLVFSRTLTQAHHAVEQMEKEVKEKYAEQLKSLTSEQAPSQQEEDEEEWPADGLAPIQEENAFSADDLSQTQIHHPSEERKSQENEDLRQNVHKDDGEEGTRDQDEEDDEDEDNSDSLESNEEEEVSIVTGGPKLLTCPEDTDFMGQFDKMMLEMLQARNQESNKVNIDITVPMSIPSQKTKYYVPGQTDIEEDDSGSTISFTLMTKKGNKPQFSALNIPSTEPFAAQFNKHKEAEKKEKEKLKQVVLNIHDRQEEEDYQEMIAMTNRLQVVPTPRDRRQRYQHPRGAPDVDLIFGNRIARR